MRLRFFHLPLCCINLSSACYEGMAPKLFKISLRFEWLIYCDVTEGMSRVHGMISIHVLWAVNATRKTRSEQDRQKFIVFDLPYFLRCSRSGVLRIIRTPRPTFVDNKAAKIKCKPMCMRWHLLKLRQ